MTSQIDYSPLFKVDSSTANIDALKSAFSQVLETAKIKKGEFVDFKDNESNILVSSLAEGSDNLVFNARDKVDYFIIDNYQVASVNDIKYELKSKMNTHYGDRYERVYYVEVTVKDISGNTHKYNLANVEKIRFLDANNSVQTVNLFNKVNGKENFKLDSENDIAEVFGVGRNVNTGDGNDTIRAGELGRGNTIDNINGGGGNDTLELTTLNEHDIQSIVYSERTKSYKLKTKNNTGIDFKNIENIKIGSNTYSLVGKKASEVLDEIKNNITQEQIDKTANSAPPALKEITISESQWDEGRTISGDENNLELIKFDQPVKMYYNRNNNKIRVKRADGKSVVLDRIDAVQFADGSKYRIINAKGDSFGHYNLSNDPSYKTLSFGLREGVEVNFNGDDVSFGTVDIGNNINTGAGNDTLYEMNINENTTKTLEHIYSGGEGTDTFVAALSSDKYTITKSGDDYILINNQDNVKTTLKSIENIQFTNADGSLTDVQAVQDFYNIKSEELNPKSQIIDYTAADAIWAEASSTPTQVSGVTEANKIDILKLSGGAYDYNFSYVNGENGDKDSIIITRRSDGKKIQVKNIEVIEFDTPFELGGTKQFAILGPKQRGIFGNRDLSNSNDYKKIIFNSDSQPTNKGEGNIIVSTDTTDSQINIFSYSNDDVYIEGSNRTHTAFYDNGGNDTLILDGKESEYSIIDVGHTDSINRYVLRRNFGDQTKDITISGIENFRFRKDDGSLTDNQTLEDIQKRIVEYFSTYSTDTITANGLDNIIYDDFKYDDSVNRKIHDIFDGGDGVDTFAFNLPQSKYQFEYVDGTDVNGNSQRVYVYYELDNNGNRITNTSGILKNIEKIKFKTDSGEYTEAVDIAPLTNTQKTIAIESLANYNSSLGRELNEINVNSFVSRLNTVLNNSSIHTVFEGRDISGQTNPGDTFVFANKASDYIFEYTAVEGTDPSNTEIKQYVCYKKDENGNKIESSGFVIKNFKSIRFNSDQPSLTKAFSHISQFATNTTPPTWYP